jgi:integrase
VRRTITVERTKSGKPRVIPINEVLFSILGDLKKKSSKSDYAFMNLETGKPFQDVKRSFNHAVKKAGIRGLRFHDLRHTFASRLVAAGVDLITVKELLGHHSVRMTERYTHSSTDQKRRAVASLTRQEPAIFVPNLSTKREELPLNVSIAIS